MVEQVHKSLNADLNRKCANWENGAFLCIEVPTAEIELNSFDVHASKTLAADEPAHAMCATILPEALAVARDLVPSSAGRPAEEVGPARGLASSLVPASSASRGVAGVTSAGGSEGSSRTYLSFVLFGSHS